MAIVLEANYAKKLGLPGYSSHQYSISIRTELTDLSQVEAESERLYQLLQSAVDKDIQHVGFMPDSKTYGTNGNGHAQPQNNGRTYQINRQPNGSNGYQQPKAPPAQWNCTEGQRGFILRIISDNKMDKQEAEDLSLMLFGIGVNQLDKMQASQLIEDLLVKAGKPARQTRWQKQPTNHQAA